MAKKNTNGEAKPRRARQGHLPTMEPPSIPALDQAAEAYVEARDGRMAMLKKEVDAHDNLRGLMHEHKLKVYSFEGYDVALEGVEKVKVKRKKEEAGEEG